MRTSRRPWLTTIALVLFVSPALAQTAPPPATPPAAPPAAPAASVPADVAAMVNGQPIPEAAVQRGLERVPPARHAEVRPELLNILIDIVLIDQHLRQLQVAVDDKDVEKHLEEFKETLKKQGRDFAKTLQDRKLTEAELKQDIAQDLRWEKYAATLATDKALKELYDGNKEMFDGSMIRVRHILLTPPSNDAKACEAAVAELQALRKQIDDQVNAGLAKLPANADALAREQDRTKLLDEAFAAKAKEKSACPSKAQGGDVGWFLRTGIMVEAFAKTAFALKPFQISDPVKTQFGYHLIMPLERKPGREVKFEEVKDEVKEVFCERQREALAAQVRQRAKIVIAPAPAAPTAPATPTAAPAPKQ
jgi:peptidyl-prolyl cis-trans isomerase C